jgi:hypothetical protein
MVAGSNGLLPRNAADRLADERTQSYPARRAAFAEPIDFVSS